MTLTLEQHQALMTLLQQSNLNGTIVNQISTPLLNKTSGIVSTFSNLFPLDTWILDTGASIHVCNNLSLFQHHQQISPIHVKLPNGANIEANIFGTIYFESYFCLSTHSFINLSIFLLPS